MDALHTPIIGETPKARALEEVRLANLAERTRLEILQHALDWRSFSTHSTNVLESGSLSPVDDRFFRLNLRYTALRFKISQLHPE